MEDMYHIQEFYCASFFLTNEKRVNPGMEK